MRLSSTSICDVQYSICDMHILTIHLYVQTNDAHIMFKEMDLKKKAFHIDALLCRVFEVSKVADKRK